MPVLAALALLTVPHASQETVAFRLNPPLDRVLEFVIGLEAERTDGTPLLTARVVVAQRAKAEGPNFRLSRYVSFASGEGTEKLAKAVKEFTSLNGRTFPLLLSPEGKSLPFKRGKYENNPSDLPSFGFSHSGSIAVGEEITLSGSDLQPAGQVKLREVREIGDQRAAIFAFTGKPDSGMESGTGTLVMSVTDGMILLVDLTGLTRATKELPATRLHLRVQRQNVPGLDRLAADLQIED